MEKIKKDELEKKYRELKTFVETAKFYNVNVKTIKKWIDEYKIKKNNIGSQGARIHNFNENFFETIDTEEKAYWLGFLYADGCIYKSTDKKSLRLQINLSKKDKEHLELFQKSINSDYKIQDKIINGKYEICCLKINSTKMCKNLIDNGVIEKIS